MKKSWLAARVIVMISLLWGGGFLVIKKLQVFTINETANHLHGILEVQEKRINEVLLRYIDIVQRIQRQVERQPSLILNLDDRTSQKNILELGRIILDSKTSTQEVRSVSIANSEQVVVASSQPENIGLNLKSRWRRVPPFPPKTAHIHEIYKDKNNLINMRIHTPLILEGQLHGLIELELNADALLAIAQDHSGLGSTGEIFLAEKNNAGDVVMLTPLRFNSSAALRLGVAKQKTNNPMVQAFDGKPGVSFREEMVDYRGQIVFSATKFLEPLEWGLVVKIDRAEALAPALELQKLIILLMLIASLFILGSVNLKRPKDINICNEKNN